MQPLICKAFSIVIISTLFGCQSMVFLFYGIKKPKPVSSNTIIQNAKKYGIDTSRLYTIRSEYYPEVVKQVGTFPNIHIYDREGKLYQYWNTPDDCKANAASFLIDLGSNSNYKFLADSSFFRFQVQLENLSHLPFSLNHLPDADFYGVVFWGTFLGRLNREYVEHWIQVSEENKKADIHLIFVSCDMRKDWKKEYWRDWETTPN